MVRRATEKRWHRRSAHPEAAALSGGVLLQELTREAEDAAAGQAKQRLSIYSGHDSTLISLLAVMGAYKGQWPPVASTVVLESWWNGESAATGKSGAFIRVIFNGELVMLPGCEAQLPAAQGGLIPLEDFRRFIVSRVPEKMEEACHSRGGAASPSERAARSKL